MRASAKFGSLIFLIFSVSPQTFAIIVKLKLKLKHSNSVASPSKSQPGTVRDVVGLPAPQTPLVGAQPGEEEEEERHGEVGRDDVDPHVEGERGEEGEEVGVLLGGLLVQNGHAEVHEGHGEVHPLLPLVGDGDVGHHQVGLLGLQLSDHPVPLPCVLVEAPVLAVLHQLDGVVEVEDLGDLLHQVHAVPLVPSIANQGLTFLLQHQERSILKTGERDRESLVVG